MPGYCVAGTVGHKILSGQKKIELDKKNSVGSVSLMNLQMLIPTPSTSL